MIIDIGFEIGRISIKESDELISIIQECVDDWAKEYNKDTAPGCSIFPHLYMKSISKENV